MKWGIEELLLFEFLPWMWRDNMGYWGYLYMFITGRTALNDSFDKRENGSSFIKGPEKLCLWVGLVSHRLVSTHAERSSNPKIQTHRSLEPLERLDEVGRHEHFCCQWVNESVCSVTSWLISSAYGLLIWEFGSCQCSTSHIFAPVVICTFCHFVW